MLNAMTVDLEDWAQAVLGPHLPVTDHVVRNTDRLLRLLDEHHVRATFFALGKVCESCPELLKAVCSAGHEIATHGYGHELVYNQTPAAFEEDVRRSMDLIESQIGSRPIGYRAPAFSITRRSLWAGPILAKLGIRYSSSVFPIRKQRYGINDWPTGPGVWPDCPLIEFPLTTLTLLGRNIPVCGGGYMRLFPAAVQAWAIARRNRAGQPAVVYLHPYELSIDEVSQFKQAGFTMSKRRYVMQSLWRSRVTRRLSSLFDNFAFGTMSQALTTITSGRTSGVVD
jgi:polysaccharide deacetylase family protein (PEP-CTERM system associated)